MTAPLQATWWRELTRRERDPRVTTTVLAVAAVMAAYASKDGTSIRPGHERVAEETRTSVPTVKRAVSVLVDLGWLVLERRGRYRTETPANVYRLGFPAERGITSEPSLVTPWPNEGSPTTERGITGSKNEGSPVSHYQSSDQSIDHFVSLGHDHASGAVTAGVIPDHTDQPDEPDWDEPFDGPLAEVKSNPADEEQQPLPAPGAVGLPGPATPEQIAHRRAEYEAIRKERARKWAQQ